MSTILRFKFKGQRSYVHGADIVNSVMAHFSYLGNTQFDIKFNGMSTYNLSLVPGDESERAKALIAITRMEENETEYWQLLETDEPVTDHYEYHEENVRLACELSSEEKLVSLLQDPPFTFCENIVAMNKYLLETLFPEVGGKWYFTKIELFNVPEDNAKVSVKLVKNFGFRLTKSNITYDGRVIGVIYFSLA